MLNMVRQYDIAEFSPSDGLTPRQTDKLNANFRRLMRMIYIEEPEQYDALQLSFPVSVSQGGTGGVGFLENSILVGNGAGPLFALAPGTGFLYSNGGLPYWRSAETGDSNWFGQGSPTGQRDPSTDWGTAQEKAEHAGDIYWSTDQQGGVWYWGFTGSPQMWRWNPLPVSGGSGGTTDYSQLTNKPTITEVDLGVRQNGTFGPLGTTTTVTIEGDDNYDGRLMKVLTNADLQAIIDAVEAS